MKQPVTLALASTLMLTTLVGCTAGAAQTSGADTPSLADAKPTAAQTAENFSNEMKIEHAVDLSPEDGADSVERAGDHEDSPYFKHPDFYNMESTDTLTILPKFKTIQQTSEWSCGVDAILMATTASWATGTRRVWPRCAMSSPARWRGIRVRP